MFTLRGIVILSWMCIVSSRGAFAQVTGSVTPTLSSTNAAESGMPAMSGDGRYVAFQSWSGDLLPAGTDTNLYSDVFVFDHTTATIERASISSGGTQADLGSYYPAISSDGRYVAFESDATNLVASDTNGLRDVFIRDRQTGLTELVSVPYTGTGSNGSCSHPAMSSDGRYVVFESSATNLTPVLLSGTNRHIYVRDRLAGSTSLLSISSSSVPGDHDSYRPSISSDGNIVAFVSASTNLVSGDTNGVADVFTRNRISNVTRRASIKTGGGQADFESYSCSVSANGRYVAFESVATNLVNSDTNAAADVFVYDRTLATTERVSLTSTGAQIAGASQTPVVSSEGRFVSFVSGAAAVVPGDTNGVFDVFVRDRQLGTTKRVSVNSSSVQGNGASFRPAIAPDGSHLALISVATNFTAVDTNGWIDVFYANMP